MHKTYRDRSVIYTHCASVMLIRTKMLSIAVIKLWKKFVMTVQVATKVPLKHLANTVFQIVPMLVEV